jgi:hypothetical protein
VQHGLSAGRFRVRDSGGEALAMVVAVGDNADFQIISLLLSLAPPPSFSYYGPDARRLTAAATASRVPRDNAHPSIFYGGITFFSALASPYAVKISAGKKDSGLIVAIRRRKPFSLLGGG